MADLTGCFTMDETTQFVAEMQNVVLGAVEKSAMRMSPYLDVLPPGTFPIGASRTVRSIVQERAVMAASMARPQFSTDVTLCGVPGSADQLGSTEYTYALETYRGRGPEICVKEARYSVKDSFVQAAQALANGVTDIVNADIRYFLFQRSGLKFTIADGYTFGQQLNGDMYEIDTAWPSFLPSSPMTWKALERLADFLEIDMMSNQYTTPVGEMFKAIVSKEQLNLFRDELDVKEDLRALTTGQYKIGQETLQGFKFRGPWRGVAFGIDPWPLRFNVLTAGGVPDLIEPVISVALTHGVGQRANPDWQNATYEIMFLMAPDSFERKTPESYTGDGKMKFTPHNVMGDLLWHYQLDNSCNLWGDFGFYKYEISRAYRPKNPHRVIAIAYKRCNQDLGQYACTTSGNGL